MINRETYLQGLLDEIERAKINGKKSVYRINTKISPDIAGYVENYFKSNPSYIIEIKFCQNCKNTYDIVIHFIS